MCIGNWYLPTTLSRLGWDKWCKTWKPNFVFLTSFFFNLPFTLFLDAIPEELVEPLYKDQYHQEHLKPPVACLLQSAELYCRAGSLILRSDAVKPLVGHNAVIQALAQKGLYVTDQDKLVTERDLTSTPIHMVSGDVKVCVGRFRDKVGLKHKIFSFFCWL